MVPMVCHVTSQLVAGCLRCIRLAGESPASVSAGAPSSRLQVGGEILMPKRSVESPPGAVVLLRREAKPQAQHKVNLATS